MFQAQFGGKVGKRFKRWGLFGKARPGFRVTKVTEVTGTRVVTSGSTSFVVPDFREGKAFTLRSILVGSWSSTSRAAGWRASMWATQ